MAANLAAPATSWRSTTARGRPPRRGPPSTAARVADSPADVGAASEVVITMVVDGAQVARGAARRARASAQGAARARCASTCRRSRPRRRARSAPSSPSAASRFIDAPVTGSSPKAEDGTLTIMAGGAAADFERARPLFEAMGELVVHVGPLGQGEMIKLINNAVAAANAADGRPGAARRAGDRRRPRRAGRRSWPRARAARRCSTSRPGRCARTTTRRCSSSSTCSRTCACASRRRRPRACRSRPPARAREVLVAAMARGHGDDDFAALARGARGLRRDPSRRAERHK